MKRVLLVIGALIATIAVTFALLGWWSQRPEIAAPGLVEGRLSACDPAPHCVCSDNDNSADRDHWIAPIEVPVALDAEQWRRVREVLAAAGGDVAQEDHGYVHAMFTSHLFHFVDDVELRADGQRLQVRSSSRVGHSDLGANRTRVEDLRQRLTSALAVSGTAH